MGMNTSSKDDPQSVSTSDAIALTRKALRSTRKNLRDSDELLDRLKAMRSADDSPPEDEVVRDE